MDYITQRDEDPHGYSKIDRYLKRLDFFAKYNQEIRRQLFFEIEI
jgi:hypothetical protein